MKEIYIMTASGWRQARHSGQGIRGLDAQASMGKLYIRAEMLDSPQNPVIVEKWVLVRDYYPPTITVPGAAVVRFPPIVSLGPQNYRAGWTARASETDPAYDYDVQVQWYVNGVPTGATDRAAQTAGGVPVRTYDAFDSVYAEMWYVNDAGEGPHVFTSPAPW